MHPDISGIWTSIAHCMYHLCNISFKVKGYPLINFVGPVKVIILVTALEYKLARQMLSITKTPSV